jgi:hypothetical protein
MFVKPPFPYQQLAKSLPPDWGSLDSRAIDANGYYLAASALIQIPGPQTEPFSRGKTITTATVFSTGSIFDPVAGATAQSCPEWETQAISFGWL